MSSPVAIDLGELGREPPLDPELRPPARAGRWTALLAVFAALFTTMGAAGTGPPPFAPRIIPARLGDLTLAAGDRFYVMGPDPGPGLTGDRAIAVYDLPEARLLWRAPLPVGGRLRPVGTADGTLLVSTDPETGLAVNTMALQESTGRMLWRRTANFVGLTGRGDVLLWTSLDGASIASTGQEAVEAVVPLTGAVRWSYQVPAGGWLSYRHGGDRATSLVAVLPSGRVEVRDLNDGRLSVAADLLPPRNPAEPSRYAQIAADLVLVHDGHRTVTAYGLDRLDRRWTAAVDFGGEFVSPSPCGAGLCVYGRSGNVRVLDRSSGHIRWSDPRWSFVEQSGTYLLTTEANRMPGRTSLIVLDSATGRRIGDLGMWSPIGPTGADGRLLGIRIDAVGSRAWIALLDPAELTARVLGVLTDVSGACVPAPGVIICRRIDATAGVWRLPR